MAKRPKTSADSQYNEAYSDPFSVDEILAVRDDPTGPYYVAKITAMNPRTLTVHYYGCREVLLSNAVFRPCWHRRGFDDITLSFDCPAHQIAYSGKLDVKDIRHVLVALSSLRPASFAFGINALLPQFRTSFFALLVSVPTFGGPVT
jgi:hypothetical protein